MNVHRRGAGPTPDHRRYLAIGTALFVLTRFVLAALGASDLDESQRILINGLVACAYDRDPRRPAGVPGLRLTEEKALIEASAKVDL